MGNKAETIVVRESDARGAAFAYITIQPKDLRPFVLKRWSGTGIASVWSLDDRSFGAYYWRARSREKLVVKALRKLRRKALSLGIDEPVVVVTDADGLSSAGMLEDPVRPDHEPGAHEAARRGERFEIDVIAEGAGPLR
jgi:hypothetical protein